MTRALTGRANVEFEVPEGVSFADIDTTTGKLGTPACPQVVHSAFLTGTEPTEMCDLHH
jgi:membrane carboxypeptidase/penicillin-binding protein